MDFIFELFFEIILEGIFDVTIKNPKVKTWIKTVIFLLLAETVVGLMVWMSVVTYQNGNHSGGIACGVISVALGIGFLLGAIYGHRQKWKQD